MATEVKLPELGENITEGDVVKIHVSPGDTIEVDQPLMELETDKASFDVPSEVAGTVKEIKVEEGGKVEVGSVIMLIEEQDAGGSTQEAEDSPAPEEEEPKEEKEPAEKEKEPEEEEKEPEEEEKEPEEKEKESEEEEAKEKKESASPTRERGDEEAPSSSIPPSPGPSEGVPVPAAPSVRMLARELGVDITKVKGSGSAGRITDDDVKRFAKTLITGAATKDSAPGAPMRPDLPDFSVYGDIEVEEMSKVRRMTAEQMEISWSIPAVTQHDRADVTHLEELRKAWAKRAEKAGTKLTVTAITLKVAAAALKKFPQFNASIDMRSHEIIYKKYYHLGVAVDTDRGLLVPVIRDVDKKNIIDLSLELQELAEKARSKKIKPDEMQGATFTITNLGGIGGTYFSPIINSPEVAILGMSRSTTEAVWQDGEFQPRLMLPLSLTYDHRIIDGADAARFLRWIAEALEEPLLMALEG